MNEARDRQELREQYRLAIDEYRFQVDLNWRRSEYFFVLNIGVLVAGVTLLASKEVPSILVAFVFGLGALLAVLSVFANNTQAGYYHAVRDLKKDIEGDLDLADLAIATTPGMGSRISRLGKVGTFLKTMLIAIACVDLTGVGIAVDDAVDTGSEKSAAQIVIRARSQASERGEPTTVVVSRDRKVVATRSGTAGQLLQPIRLEPGRYRVWAVGAERCSRAISVSSAALQLAEISCPARAR